MNKKSKNVYLANSNRIAIKQLKQDIGIETDTYVSESKIIDTAISYFLSNDKEEIYRVLSFYNCF